MVTNRRLLISEALDWIVHQQRAVDFQRVAVQIAKTKWPELEATELGSDNGEDATFHVTGRDGIRRVLACSLTGTLEKIRHDASRVKSEGKRIDVLVFTTPTAITNVRLAKWRNAIRAEFGHDLHVIPRAEIIALLERPEHEFLCREYLHLRLTPNEERPGADSDVEIKLGIAGEKKRELLSFFREITPLLERFGVDLIEVKRVAPWAAGTSLLLVFIALIWFIRPEALEHRLDLAKNEYDKSKAILAEIGVRGSTDMTALDRARRAVIEAVEIYRQASQEKGGQYQEELAQALMVLGQVESASGREVGAIGAYEEALEIFQRLSNNQENRYAVEKRTLSNRLKDLKQ